MRRDRTHIDGMGFTADNSPEKRREVRSPDFCISEIDASSVGGGLNFGARSNDARILKQSLNIRLFETGNFDGVEPFESFAKGVALAQDNNPSESGLKSFEHQQFPEGAAVAHGHTPLSVVIFAQQRIALSPGASGFSLRCGHGLMVSREMACHARGEIPQRVVHPLIVRDGPTILAAYGRKTTNQQVVTALQDALTAFLDDHRKFAMSPTPETIDGWEQNEC